ncbi:hypothetical protein CI238_12685, partial [Colletotrichum incanum]
QQATACLKASLNGPVQQRAQRSKIPILPSPRAKLMPLCALGKGRYTTYAPELLVRRWHATPTNLFVSHNPMLWMLTRGSKTARTKDLSQPPAPGCWILERSMVVPPPVERGTYRNTPRVLREIRTPLKVIDFRDRHSSAVHHRFGRIIRARGDTRGAGEVAAGSMFVTRHHGMQMTLVAPFDSVEAL